MDPLYPILMYRGIYVVWQVLHGPAGIEGYQIDTSTDLENDMAQVLGLSQWNNSFSQF